MAITEKQQERIDRFKAAFKSIAAAKNKGIRWTQPKNRLQTRTSPLRLSETLHMSDPSYRGTVAFRHEAPPRL